MSQCQNRSSVFFFTEAERMIFFNAGFRKPIRRTDGTYLYDLKEPEASRFRQVAIANELFIEENQVFDFRMTDVTSDLC